MTKKKTGSKFFFISTFFLVLLGAFFSLNLPSGVGIAEANDSFVIASNGDMPDLTGTWTSFTNSCKETKRGIKCKAKGKLSIQNSGILDAPSSYVRFYISYNTVFDEGEDEFLKQVATGKIKKSKSKTKTFSCSFGYGVQTSGRYIIAVIDADNTVAETDEVNNDIIYGIEGGDTTPPAVISTSPVSNATGVGINGSITATFTEAVDPSTMDTSTFTLSGVTGAVSYSGTTAVFTPSTSLDYNTAYTATITTGVRDLAGNAPAADYIWSFTTRGSEPVTNMTNLFFLHHSTGEGLIVEGDMRSIIAAYNAANGTNFQFWDHGYNGDGLRNPAGESTGTSYDIPDDNTDPDGLYNLWTSTENRYVAARNLILNNHEVIAFKSCFPASAIEDSAMLQQYINWYLAMRDFFDTRSDRLFIVMSTPPLHRLATNSTAAINARAFADWLCSDQYLSGHPNVRCFNLFDQLAQSNDGSAVANMLRYVYEGSHTNSDSHPNTFANQTVGPVFANFLCDAAAGY